LTESHGAFRRNLEALSVQQLSAAGCVTYYSLALLLINLVA